jgi:hypothetical protein
VGIPVVDTGGIVYNISCDTMAKSMTWELLGPAFGIDKK